MRDDEGWKVWRIFKDDWEDVCQEIVQILGGGGLLEGER